MKKLTYLGVLMVGGACAANAPAAVYFSDDFEAQPLTSPVAPGTPLQPPPIGIEYRYAATTQVEAVNVVTAPKPVIGTKSLETVRNATQGQAHVIAASNAGALVDGQTVQVSWNHQLASGTGHRFNAPMQNSIGYSNGGVGQLAFISIADTPGHGGEYHYTNAGNTVATGIQPTLNGWDSLRVVMTLDAFNAQFMTGTYDLYISLNGGPEVLVADNAGLNFGLIATPDDAENELTSLWFRMQKGPETSNSYYDNIYVGDPMQIPEPVSAAMSGALFGLLALRRPRR